MPKIFMPEATETDRLIILKQNADKVEQTTYQKPLTEEQISERMGSLTKNCIKLADVEEEKKEAMIVFKEQIDPLKKDNSRLLLEIRTGQVKTQGDIYYMANYEDNMMEVYDDEGALIESRRLLPSERQLNILRAVK